MYLLPKASRPYGTVRRVLYQRNAWQNLIFGSAQISKIKAKNLPKDFKQLYGLVNMLLLHHSNKMDEIMAILAICPNFQAVKELISASPILKVDILTQYWARFRPSVALTSNMKLE
jgi:hypothetical protein